MKNGRKRNTLRKWVGGKAIDLWMFPPKTQSIYSVRWSDQEVDVIPQTIHEWVTGRSREKGIEALEEANNQCQVCGSKENLIVHHKGGLRGYRTTKDLAMAGGAKARKVLCKECHLKAHHGSYAPRNRSQKTA
jgi:5-methylcytosine-specific restriction endonuclease McrA